MSETGSFRYDGDKDMKVLRSKAEDAVYFFNQGHPRIEMQTSITGFVFSLIDNGKLSDKEDVYKGNVIIRSLRVKNKGMDAGNVVLVYDDGYNDGRGQGGYGSIIIGNVRSVFISGNYLTISGMNGSNGITYRYLIQESPDRTPFTKPIPKVKCDSDDEDNFEDIPIKAKPRKTASKRASSKKTSPKPSNKSPAKNKTKSKIKTAAVKSGKKGKK